MSKVNLCRSKASCRKESEQGRAAMEALYLLASLAATLVTTAFQSLLLFLRLLFQRSDDSSGGSAAGATRLYEGRVRHSRRRPAAHAFEYPVRYALVDLDRLPLPDHLSADDARRIASTSGPVRLLTIPKSVGYEQNPLSIYYCYDSAGQGQDGELRICIAEVTNTPWGERVMFTFQPDSDLVAKPLHVSPFMVIAKLEGPAVSLYCALCLLQATLDESLYELAGELVRFLLRSGRDFENATSDSEKLSPRFLGYFLFRSPYKRQSSDLKRCVGVWLGS